MELKERDPILLGWFARRLHVLEEFTTDRATIEERLPYLEQRPTVFDDGTALYESIIKGITILEHGPSERRALVVITGTADDCSRRGVEDIIARAEFARVMIYAIILAGGAYPTFSTVHDALSRVTSATGGDLYVVYARGDRPDMMRTAESIAAGVDRDYMLGFPFVLDGNNILPVELSLVNHPGMHVRTLRTLRFPLPEADTPAMPPVAAGGLPE
jgi:hypothetical protein